MIFMGDRVSCGAVRAFIIQKELEGALGKHAHEGPTFVGRRVCWLWVLPSWGHWENTW